MRHLLRRVSRLFHDKPTPVILMYHRIADQPVDPWGLAVTPKHFAEQMEVLREVRLPLSMNEFVARLEAGTLPRQAVAVTFDDGYIDNLTDAEPILRRAGVPATIFLATGPLGQKGEFWWDELARMVFGQRAGVDVEVTIDGRPVVMRLPPLAPDVSAAVNWRAWDPPTSPREQLYVETWRLLRDLKGVVRADAMKELRNVFDQGRADPAGLPMTREDVSLISARGIEVGAHSRSHPRLTTLTPDERRREIEGSRVECEQLAGRPVKGFAYPYGDRDARTTEMVKDGGFEWACSTQDTGVNPEHFDPFDLPRRQVLNWSASEFAGALRNVRCPE